MIIYRPQRGALVDAVAEAKEFENLQKMKEYIAEQWNGYVLVEDIVLGNEIMCDDRINWRDVRYVCTKKMGSEDYVEKYGCPQCIGYCATEYLK